METSEFYGVRSFLDNVYNSVLNNNYFAQAEPSQALKNLSKDQTCTYLSVITATNIDTITVPKDNLPDALMAGDLRLYGAYNKYVVNQDVTSDYSANRQTIRKLPSAFVPMYRVQYIYLLFAEALNRAGFPHSAFAVLKYGLRNEENEKRILPTERAAAGELINFPNDAFTANNTMGIHGRGCGDTQCDKTYEITQTLTQTTDTITMVEDLIVNEMALETAFEGQRYYTLMRIAKRRGDNSYLAEPISKREGIKDPARYELLMNSENWYLPINTK